MSTVYEQLDKLTARFGAYAITKGAKHIGRIIFDHGINGMRTTCYAQVWGCGMARGFARGGGYDKQSASAEAAIAAIIAEKTNPSAAHVKAWQAALRDESGQRWTYRLEAAGYTVQHVI